MKTKTTSASTNGKETVRFLFSDFYGDSIKRLKIAIWALVIFQVIFVPCVIIAINSLWGAIL